MKSILFRHFRDKLLDQSKQRTFRVLFIPTYEIDEIVKIDFKENDARETLYSARVISIYPLQIKDVGLHEAKLDGFDSVHDFRKGIMKINKIKSINRWGFFTLFFKIETIFDYIQPILTEENIACT